LPLSKTPRRSIVDPVQSPTNPADDKSEDFEDRIENRVFRAEFDKIMNLV